MNPYIGQESQIYGIEEHRLVGGLGDGMRLLEIRNGKGMEMTVALDRCCDISRLTCDGINMNWFSPSGYAAPAYYSPIGPGWLKTFTAGFLTTCGLESVGNSCVDEGETMPVHGSITGRPASEACWYEENGELTVRAVISDETMFKRKLRLYRTIHISLSDKSFRICDRIENTGWKTEPMEILYHMNIGYPLLDEDSIVEIPAASVTPRNDHAAEDIANCLKMEKPQPGYQERCYYHKFKGGKGLASISQPKLGKKLTITFDSDKLDGFVEWKMMGFREYVLGLECGNCYPDGRDVMRKTGMLKFLEPGEKAEYAFQVRID